MRASELIFTVSAFIAEYGDLEILYDCDNFLEQPGSAKVVGKPYFDPPILVISLSPLPADFGNPEVHAPRH